MVVIGRHGKDDPHEHHPLPTAPAEPHFHEIAFGQKSHARRGDGRRGVAGRVS
jgi:hypothetical protein